MKIRKIYIVLLIIVFIVTGYKLIYIKMSNDYKIRMNTPSTYSDRIGISIPKDSLFWIMEMIMVDFLVMVKAM